MCNDIRTAILRVLRRPSLEAHSPEKISRELFELR